MYRVKKRTAVLLLFLMLALLLSACGADYSGEGFLGTYENGEGYTLTLKANGRGTLSHLSFYGNETEEEVLFDLEKDGTLVLHGTAEQGGVIGRSEFYGKPVEKDGVYSLTLRAVDSGINLGTFKQKQ